MSSMWRIQKWVSKWVSKGANKQERWWSAWVSKYISMSVNKLVNEYTQTNLYVRVCVCVHAQCFWSDICKIHTTQATLWQHVWLSMTATSHLRKHKHPILWHWCPFPSFLCMLLDNLLANGHCLVQAQQNLLAGAGAGLWLEPLDQIWRWWPNWLLGR